MILHTPNPDRFRDPDSVGRWYLWDDARFLSVTTALKLGVPSPYLNKWHAKVVADYVDQNWEDLTPIREGADDGEFVRLLKAQPTIVRDTAGDFGSLVHELAERYVLTGEAPTVEQYGKAAVKRIDHYRNWIDVMGPEFVAVETVVYSREHQYAGTLDLIVDLPGYGRVIVDLKSGRGVYGTAAAQQAAYRHAEFLVVGDSEIPMPETDAAFVLHLTPRLWKLVPVETNRIVWGRFLSALHTAKWIAGHGPSAERHAISKPVAKGHG